MNAKKELTLDFSKNAINMTESFSKKAQNYGSTEYNMLQNALKDFPEFEIVVTKKTKRVKDAHKGIDVKFMYNYIKQHDNDEEEVMNLFKGWFKKLEETDDGIEYILHNDVEFLNIRSWFLDQYTEFDEAIKTRKDNLKTIIDLKAA